MLERALASAALVGLFTVLNKWLLTENVPTLTAAAWTYLAAGIALLPWALRAKGLNFRRPGVMIGWLLAGSVAGPSLYFLGLNMTSGVEGVLMINMEAAFTAILAFVIFREKLTTLGLLAGLAILSGGIWISWPQSGGNLMANNTMGNLLIAAGYIGWATENNLGRLLGEAIPSVTLVCLKALVAGIVMAGLAAVFGQPLAVGWHVIPGILLSGAIALGLSLALFYLAMQHIGAGRTGLLASTSSLWGVLAAMIFLRESINPVIVGGGLLMLLGLCGFGLDAEARKMER